MFNVYTVMIAAEPLQANDIELQLTALSMRQGVRQVYIKSCEELVQLPVRGKFVNGVEFQKVNLGNPEYLDLTGIECESMTHWKETETKKWCLPITLVFGQITSRWCIRETTKRKVTATFESLKKAALNGTMQGWVMDGILISLRPKPVTRYERVTDMRPEGPIKEHKEGNQYYLDVTLDAESGELGDLVSGATHEEVQQKYNDLMAAVLRGKVKAQFEGEIYQTHIIEP